MKEETAAMLDCLAGNTHGPITPVTDQLDGWRVHDTPPPIVQSSVSLVDIDEVFKSVAVERGLDHRFSHCWINSAPQPFPFLHADGASSAVAIGKQLVGGARFVSPRMPAGP
jgi:hypothetical protein